MAKARRGIVGVLLAGVVIFLVVGVLWAMLYWGILLPAKDLSVNTFGTNIYDPNTLSIMLWTGALFGIIMTGSVIYWWWAKSQKVYAT